MNHPIYINENGQTSFDPKPGFVTLPVHVGYTDQGNVFDYSQRMNPSVTWVNWYTDRWVGNVSAFDLHMARIYHALVFPPFEVLNWDEPNVLRLAFTVPSASDSPPIMDVIAQRFIDSLAAAGVTLAERHDHGDEWDDDLADSVTLKMDSGVTVRLMIRYLSE